VNRGLIVDDHSGFRGFARSLLGAQGLEVVGEAEAEASSIEAAAAATRRGVTRRPAARERWLRRCPRLRTSDPKLIIVLTSSRDTEEFSTRLANAPVAGFVHDDELSAAALIRVAR
jgi:DNA-binding NarL/FixJ family response regulator